MCVCVCVFDQVPVRRGMIVESLSIIDVKRRGIFYFAVTGCTTRSHAIVLFGLISQSLNQSVIDFLFFKNCLLLSHNKNDIHTLVSVLRFHPDLSCPPGDPVGQGADLN